MELGTRLNRGVNRAVTEHGSVRADKLIPIGPDVRLLSQQIEECLQTGVRGQRPVDVASFEDQARKFAGIVDQILEGAERAA